VLDNPQVTFEEWERAVRSMIAQPPGWMDDAKWTPGHLFGGRAVSHTLARINAGASQTPGQRVVSGGEADQQQGWDRQDF
jgi:hypothetical protein